MVCPSCRTERHDQCRGGTWCDCQHQPAARPDDDRLSWIRQG